MTSSTSSSRGCSTISRFHTRSFPGGEKLEDRHGESTKLDVEIERARQRGPSSMTTRWRRNDREPWSVPLFPLRTVLFPGGILPLKVFESRYVEMTKDCMKD